MIISSSCSWPNRSDGISVVLAPLMSPSLHPPRGAAGALNVESSDQETRNLGRRANRMTTPRPSARKPVTLAAHPATAMNSPAAKSTVPSIRFSPTATAPQAIAATPASAARYVALEVEQAVSGGPRPFGTVPRRVAPVRIHPRTPTRTSPATMTKNEVAGACLTVGLHGRGPHRQTGGR